MNVLILGLLVLVILILLLLLKSRERRGEVLLLSQQMGQLTTQLNEQLNAIVQQVNQRLKENTQMLQENSRSINERLDRAAAVISPLQNKLGELGEASKRMIEIGKDISRLETLLKAPKFRGEIGEFLLENLLAQILPKDFFRLQYRFKSGEKVDAVICLGERIVPVDSKFPLESFRRLIEEDREVEKRRLYKEFERDVKKHIEEIANKYILPDEGTYNFALMYIPAENIYYETITRQEEKGIWSYALARKVIPVSPNSFYAYLMVIVEGLRGMQIEKDAQRIIVSLSRLKQDLDRFSEDFNLLGTHLKNSRKKYDDANKSLEHFCEKLSEIAQIEEKKEITGEHSLR